MNKISMKGWVAFVTGGAGGIGREICRDLIARGVRCIVADIDETSLSRACRHLGPLAVPCVIDLSNRNASELAISAVKKLGGRLDILVNNAAITDAQPFEQRSGSSIAREIEINLIAPLLLTNALLPYLRVAPSGRILNTVSLGGIFPLPETTVYSATKFGLRGAMLCLGLDGKRLGVNVSSVLPSATETPQLMREAMEGGNKLQFIDPPQKPADVALQVARMLDDPILERYPRGSESWLVRLAMLLPNQLPKLIPLFSKRGERGHKIYLDSLKKRGIVIETEQGLKLKAPADILG